jgi:hypothetical protein
MAVSWNQLMRCSAIRRARDVFSAATEMATVMKSRPTDLRKFFSDLVDFAIYVVRFYWSNNHLCYGCGSRRPQQIRIHVHRYRYSHWPA